MQLVLLCAPSLVALAMLYFGYRGARAVDGWTPSPLRLLGAYALLLPAFAVGTCWGWLFDALGMLYPWLVGIGLFAFTAWYLWRMWKASQKPRDESIDEDALPMAHRGAAALGIAVLFGLAMALLVVFAGERGASL